MPSPRPRLTLTDDEIAWCLKGHRERAVELITRPQVNLAARRLAKVALKHHEARIALLKAAAEGTRDDVAGG